MTDPTCNCKTTPCSCHRTYEWLWDSLKLNPSIVLSENQQDILFHRTFSTGTAAVRGTQPFEANMHYYWEIRILTTLYGTDVMIGVGTDLVDVNFLRNRFCRMLGSDQNSWGYSYRGEVQHDGEFYKYGRNFDRNSVVGCHLDMCKGTLEFYHNRERLGVAFTALKQYAGRLFPIVCSTAAQSAISLNTSISIKPSLMFAALRKLKKREQLEDVYMAAPPGLKRILLESYWWLIEPVPIMKRHPFMGAMMVCSSDEEEVFFCRPQRRMSSRRKRKRTKKVVTEQRLTDGPTSVENLRVDRVLRSHTRMLQPKCSRCSVVLPPPRPGPRTRRQAAMVCSNCDS